MNIAPFIPTVTMTQTNSNRLLISDLQKLMYDVRGGAPRSSFLYKIFGRPFPTEKLTSNNMWDEGRE